MKEDEGRTLWLDTQSHASSSASSADDDYTWQWPTSFWSQFKVSIHFPNVSAGECLFRLINSLEQEIRKEKINESFQRKFNRILLLCLKYYYASRMKLR